MRKLFLTGLMVLGLVTACDKDSAWEMDQERRIESLQMTAQDLQAQIDAINDKLASEITRVTQLISALRAETDQGFEAVANQFTLVEEALADAVVQLSAAINSGDEDTLFQALAAVAEAEDDLTTALETHVEEVTIALTNLGVVDANLQSSIDVLINDLNTLQSDLNADTVNLRSLIGNVAQTVTHANQAIAANTLSIEAINERVTEIMTRTRELISGLRTDVNWNAEARERLANWVGRLQNLLIGPAGYGDDRREGIAGQLDDLIATVAALPEGADVTTEILEAIADIDLDVTDIDGLEARLTELSGLISDNDRDIAALTLRVNELRAQFDMVTATVNTINGAYVTEADIDSAVSVLELSLTASITANAEALNGILETYSGALADILALQMADESFLTESDVAGLRTTVDAINTDLGNVEAAITNADGDFVDVESLQANIGTLTAQIATLQAELAALDSQVNPTDEFGWPIALAEQLAAEFTDNGDGTYSGPNGLSIDMTNNQQIRINRDDLATHEVFDSFEQLQEFLDDNPHPDTLLAFTNPNDINVVRNQPYSIQLVNFEGAYNVRVRRLSDNRDFNMNVDGNGRYSSNGHGALGSSHEIRVSDPDGGALLLTKRVNVSNVDNSVVINSADISGTNLVFTFTDNLPADNYRFEFQTPDGAWGILPVSNGAGLGVRDTGLASTLFTVGDTVQWRIRFRAGTTWIASGNIVITGAPADTLAAPSAFTAGSSAGRVDINLEGLTPGADYTIVATNDFNSESAAFDFPAGADGTVTGSVPFGMFVGDGLNAGEVWSFEVEGVTVNAVTLVD